MRLRKSVADRLYALAAMTGMSVAAGGIIVSLIVGGVVASPWIIAGAIIAPKDP